MIDLKEILSQNTIDNKRATSIVQVGANNQFLLIDRKKTLADSFGVFEHNKTYHYSTNGRWSQYELLCYILEQIGTADVYLTTWKINNDVAANIAMLKNKGFIYDLFLLLEKRIAVTSPQAQDLITSVADRYKITDIHAKVMVIENKEWSISVNGSGNMTVNPRIECGVVSTHREVSEFHKNWIIKEIYGGSR